MYRAKCALVTEPPDRLASLGIQDGDSGSGGRQQGVQGLGEGLLRGDGRRWRGELSDRTRCGVRLFREGLGHCLCRDDTDVLPGVGDDR